MLIQILISLFVVFALTRLILRFRKTELKFSEFFVWLIFWLVVGIAVWIPDITTKVANLLGIGRGADLVFYLSLVVLFYLIFRIYVKMEKIERDITKIVRKDALDSEVYPEDPHSTSLSGDDESC